MFVDRFVEANQQLASNAMLPLRIPHYNQEFFEKSPAHATACACQNSLEMSPRLVVVRCSFPPAEVEGRKEAGAQRRPTAIPQPQHGPRRDEDHRGTIHPDDQRLVEVLPGKAVRGYSRTLPGSCCDNDVHEVFKAMAECALTAAYVLERADGQIATWNCAVRKHETGLEVIPAERVVSRLHLNLRNKQAVKVIFGSGETVSGELVGMQWLGPGGTPELLR